MGLKAFKYNMKINKKRLPKHIGIIMDGNGRWAQKRGLERLAGHRKGVDAIKRVIEACENFGIKVLTLFAFSTENWKRDKDEVDGIFAIIEDYLNQETSDFKNKNYVVRTMGDISVLPKNIYEKLVEIKEKTAQNTGLIINLGINYGARDELVYAFKKIKEENQEISIESIKKNLYSAPLPDPDLIIRTSGEKRLSNFMLFQCAYSELYFAKTFWPSFTKKHLKKALKSYAKRDRRFGGNHSKIQNNKRNNI